MSDTPRTDAHYNRLDDYWQHDVDFARTLERENNQLRATLEEIACVGHIGTGVAPRIAREALSANNSITGGGTPYRGCTGSTGGQE